MVNNRYRLIIGHYDNIPMNKASFLIKQYTELTEVGI